MALQSVHCRTNVLQNATIISTGVTQDYEVHACSHCLAPDTRKMLCGESVQGFRMSCQGLGRFRVSKSKPVQRSLTTVALCGTEPRELLGTNQ